MFRRWPCFLLILLPLLFSGCMGPFFSSNDDSGDEWVKGINGPEVTHAIQHFLAYLRHEKHLRLEEASVWYNDTLNTVRMEFTSQDILEIREARFNLVDLVEGLLAELNQNSILIPSFTTFPLTPDQLEIYIKYESFEGIYLDPYYVGRVKLENGESKFYAFNIEIPGRNKWDFRIEPYEESRLITVYEREAEKVFKQLVELNAPNFLQKEQYVPDERAIPRFFSPYKRRTVFDY